MSLDPALLAILACPEDKGPLFYLEDETVLFNPRLARTYEIRDDIPVMLVEESTTVGDDEAARLQAIVTDLGVTVSGGQLVLSAYTTAFAATLVVAGRLGDRYGRRRLLAAGAGTFGVASVLAALAPNLVTLVALRAVLGVAAGLFTPQVL